MKFYEIERFYTQKVSEYISKGYVISPLTSRGVEREIQRIDLIKDHDLVRILLGRDYYLIKQRRSIEWFPYYIFVTVSHVDFTFSKDFTAQGGDFLWNSDFEVLERFEWSEIACDWYVTKEEAIEMSRKHDERLELKSAHEENLISRIPEDRKALLVKIARKRKGLKTVTPCEVTGYKCYEGHPTMLAGYTLQSRGQDFKIS